MSGQPFCLCWLLFSVCLFACLLPERTNKNMNLNLVTNCVFFFSCHAASQQLVRAGAAQLRTVKDLPVKLRMSPPQSSPAEHGCIICSHADETSR